MKYWILDELFGSGSESQERQILIYAPTMKEAENKWKDSVGLKEEDKPEIMTNEGNLRELTFIEEITEEKFRILERYITKL